MRRLYCLIACVAAMAALAGFSHTYAGEARPPAEPDPVPAEQNPIYYAELANVNMRYGEHQKAVELFTKAIELSGENIDAGVAYGLGKAYMALGDTDKADAVFLLPVETMEEHRRTSYLVTIAGLYKGEQRYEKAEETLLLAQKYCKDDDNAVMRVTTELLELYKGTPLGNKAIAAYEERLKKNANDAEAMKALLNLYLYDSNLDDATKMAERYSKARPDDIAALNDLNFFYITTMDMPKVLDTTQKLIEKDPDNKTTYYNQIIYLYNNSGELEKVEEWADLAAKDGIRSGSTYAALADSYIKAELKDKALVCYKKAMEATPTNNRYRYQYARLLDQTGKTTEAKAIFEELSKLNEANVRHLAQTALIDILKREAGEVPVGKPADK